MSSTTIELSNGGATLDQRGEYLLVVERGTIVSPHEVYRYVTELELASQRMKLRRMLVDARGESGDESTETRAAMWRWIRTQRFFDQVAYVLRDEMTIARVNMTALSEKIGVRAFPSVSEAHRWLVRSAGRQSSTTITAQGRAPSVPPPALAPGVMSGSPAQGAGSSVPPRFAAAPPALRESERLARATSTEPSRATPNEPVTRSHATLKTPAIDPASADEILRKRR
jgi:hypothetical protein